MKIRQPDRLVFNIIAYGIVGAFALICLLPFVLMLSGSLSTQKAILTHGYALWPRDFNLIAYEALFKVPTVMLNAFAISVAVTASGTFFSIFNNSIAAYALGRKDFKHRNTVAFFFYITTLFNGGLVPYYIIMMNVYRMKNSIFALILPSVVSVWNILMLRNFMKNNIPDSLPESAKIDGAGEFTIYLRIVMPMMIPSLMAIGFFTAIGYWNDWFSAMLFIDNDAFIPLQYKLYRMLSTINALAQIMARSTTNFEIPKMDLPGETVKLAMAVVAAGPIIFLFGFIQKYFVKGITVGAVKG